MQHQLSELYHLRLDASLNAHFSGLTLNAIISLLNIVKYETISSCSVSLGTWTFLSPSALCLAASPCRTTLPLMIVTILSAWESVLLFSHIQPVVTTSHLQPLARASFSPPPKDAVPQPPLLLVIVCLLQAFAPFQSLKRRHAPWCAAVPLMCCCAPDVLLRPWRAATPLTCCYAPDVLLCPWRAAVSLTCCYTLF